MIPLRDENRSQTTPHVTRILLIINIIVFVFTFLPEFFGRNWLPALLGLSDSASLERAVSSFGMVPFYVLQGERLQTLFTSMFLHADLWHLGGNMLFLYVFGDNVEDAFGHGGYLLFYFVSGLAASFAFIWIQWFSGDLLTGAIGASGAIAGVLGAYLVLYPNARILTLLLIGWIWIVPIPAVFFLGFWFIYQLLYGVLIVEAVAGVAYWAHIGGFVAGMLLGLVWRGRRRTRTL